VWFNPIVKTLLKSPFHRVVSKTMMLITFTGRKSGHVYTLPVSYFQMVDDDGVYIASVSSKDRIWWRNLRGGKLTTVFINGKSYQATSEVFEKNETVYKYFLSMFSSHANLAKWFAISINADGKPDVGQTRSLAEKSVFIRTQVNGDLFNIGK